jgi:putative two-component system response regulator
MHDKTAPKVLIVDDEEPIRELISQIIKADGYDTQTASGVDEALAHLAKGQYSLVISDINMPNKTGIDLLREVFSIDQNIAVLMATAVDDRKVAVNTLELGAYGYIIKPFERNELLINIANALRRRELEIDNRQYSEELEGLVLERTKELRLAAVEIRNSREETIVRLAKAAEFRDNETAQHTIRMGHYCAVLATRAGLHKEFCEVIRTASPLHDVGKIGIPDTILLKPAALTKEEFDIIKTHSEIGYRILGGSDSELLNLGASIAYTHHEKFNGKGYPRGLSGDDIPIEGRIAALCDVFDALTSHRVYKAAMPTEQAIDILREGRGTHFDPKLHDYFIGSLDEILVIKAKFVDG